MRASTLALIFGASVVGLLSTPVVSFAQDVVPVTVALPVYPPIAASARIAGDVEVSIGVRPDGSVASAVAVSGSPLLQEAAVTSARNSLFSCRGCVAAVTPFSIIFAFQLEGASGAATPEQQRTAVPVTKSQSRVSVVAPMQPLYIVFSNTTARSAKCLYLWLCGSQWGGRDFYFYAVRSPKCLWLWNCGYRKRGT